MESQVPRLVPEEKKAADLTMGELDIASYHLKADVLECLAGAGSAKRYAAFVEVAIMWAKRGGASENAEQLRKRFRDYEPDDMFYALRMEKAAALEPPDPTGSGDEPNGSSSPPDLDATPTP